MTSGEGSGGTTLVAPSSGGGMGEQRTLRSSRHPKVEESDAQHDEAGLHDSAEEDRALELAEEKMLIEGDEEIESIDEHGNPVVDTAQFERRMMTVALVQSVVETAGQPRSKGKDAAALRARVERTQKKSKEKAEDIGGEAQPHTYGLRTRRRGGADSDESESPPASPRSPRMRRTRHSDSSALKNPASVGGRQSTRIRAESEVPNPLVQSDVSPTPNSAVVKASPGTKGDTAKEDVPNRGLAAPMLTVPCPLAAESRPMLAPAVDASGASMTRRSRIFSIDIDPAGFEFPDMNIENELDPHLFDGSAQTHDGVGATASNPRTASLSSDARGHRKGSTGSASQDVSFAPQGRDRAMSFEFFSFGINADEPPLPEAANSDQSVMTRPRGNSIIFDPVSFHEGGIHEERLFATGSRTNSIDLVDPTGIAIASAVGAPYAPDPSSTSRGSAFSKNKKSASTRSSSISSRQDAASYRTSSSLHDRTGDSSSRQPATSASTEMATLPSSLAAANANSSLQHTTFQMELLNKDGRIGIYLPDARRARIAKFHSKRKMRIWRKRIKYDCRKKLADSRPRIKGRFVKRSDVDV